MRVHYFSDTGMRFLRRRNVVISNEVKANIEEFLKNRSLNITRELMEGNVDTVRDNIANCGIDSKQSKLFQIVIVCISLSDITTMKYNIVDSSQLFNSGGTFP